jgi:hypothetical protein
MVAGITRGALKTVIMAGAGLYLLTEILKELSFSNSLNGKDQNGLSLNSN